MQDQPYQELKQMKILVISMAGIGDTLLATPLIQELRANFPGATIDALVMWAGSRDLLENNPHVNRVFQKNLIHCSRLEGLRFLWSLRREHYDFSINTHPQSRRHYRVTARIVGAATRISHEYECRRITPGTRLKTILTCCRCSARRKCCRRTGWNCS
jgi:ADP-heptose:LPS heptosyltransferase